MLNDEGIINETLVEEDSMWVVLCDKHSLFEVGVVYSCIGASTGGTHGGAIQLPPASVPKGKDVVAHDDIQANKDFF